MNFYVSQDDINRLIDAVFKFYQTDQNIMGELRKNYDISPTDLAALEKRADKEIIYLTLNMFMNKPVGEFGQVMLSCILAGLIYGYSLGLGESQELGGNLPDGE